MYMCAFVCVYMYVHPHECICMHSYVFNSFLFAGVGINEGIVIHGMDHQNAFLSSMESSPMYCSIKIATLSNIQVEVYHKGSYLANKLHKPFYH